MVQLADHPAFRIAPAAPVAPADLAAARRSLRDQIALLERRLSDALVTAFPHEPVDVSVPGLDGPRLLGLGELEALRDELAARLRVARATLDEIAERREQARLLLESMYAEPGHHRFVRLPRRELGLPGCGVYQVRPRLGLVGMLAGWWHVKLSSGCPLAGRGEPAVQPNTLPAMGRRSRKRSLTPSERAPEAPSRPAPAPAARPAPAALRRRAPASQRPPAPWGAFPLGELTTLAGIGLLIGGFVARSPQLLAVGFALVGLAATELAAREHFAGFRSHSALLALILGAVTVVVLVIAGVPRTVQIGAGAAAFVGGFFLLRRAFQRRSGGLGFRA